MSHVEEGTLHAMLDGELTGTEATAVKAHLDQCAQCRALLDEVKEFVAEADTLIVTLDEHTALAAPLPRSPAEEGGQAEGRYGGSGRPWYRQPQFLAAAATITLAIGAGYIGLALRDQGLLTDQPELLSEAGVPPARVVFRCTGCQMDGTLRPRCGSLARSGNPVADALGPTIQLLLPRSGA